MYNHTTDLIAIDDTSDLIAIDDTTDLKCLRLSKCDFYETTDLKCTIFAGRLLILKGETAHLECLRLLRNIP